MSTEPAGGTISGNSSDTNTITDQQLFDHAVSSPDPTPAPSPPSSPPSSTPSSGAQASEQPASPGPICSSNPRNRTANRERPMGSSHPSRRAAAAGAQRTTGGIAEGTRRKAEAGGARGRVDAGGDGTAAAYNPQQPQQPQGPQTIYDDPDTYLDQRVMQPLRQEGQMYMMKIKDDMSRVQANTGLRRRAK